MLFERRSTRRGPDQVRLTALPSGACHKHRYNLIIASPGIDGFAIEQLAIQVTGDVAMDYYRNKATWANSAGAEVRTDRLRITHTWTRTHGTWEIIGGMSSPVNATGQ